MFRTIGDQPWLWESVLPPEVLRLPEELARVEALLDDPVFFAPFAAFFGPQMGRPSTPVECYLRLMFWKFRYRLGFESLCAEVADSITWRRFCRIPLDGRVPHPTTLMKLTSLPPNFSPRLFQVEVTNLRRLMRLPISMNPLVARHKYPLRDYAVRGVDVGVLSQPAVAVVVRQVLGHRTCLVVGGGYPTSAQFGLAPWRKRHVRVQHECPARATHVPLECLGNAPFMPGHDSILSFVGQRNEITE